MKGHFTIMLLLLACASPSFSQDPSVSDSIEALERSLEDYNEAIDDIFRDLETLKLKKIRSTISSIGMAAPLPGEQLVHHDAFSLSYNEEHEQANYVVHVITKDILYGNVSRTNDFRLDPKVETVTADSADYWDSGYDRGHLAPSADFRWSRDALSQSYYYSNMSPQRPELNREAWARLENLIREFAIDAGEVVVATGPVLREGLPKIPQGSLRVSIPELYFKAVIDVAGDEKRGIAFILPNGKAKFRIMDYAVSIDSVEELTGIDLFASLDDGAEREVESNSSYDLWPVTNDATAGDVRPVDLAKGQVTAKQAKYYIGEEATVCGQVVSTKFNQNGKSNPTYINLDKKFPDQVFTLVIFGKDRVNFSYEPEKFLYDKRICITGKVAEWNGLPQMIIDNEVAIEVLPGN